MLKTLNVSWNGFAKEGCAAMAQALVHNSTLQELNLTCNRIQQDAMAFLMKGLQKNDGLITLRVCTHKPITSLEMSMMSAQGGNTLFIQRDAGFSTLRYRPFLVICYLPD